MTKPYQGFTPVVALERGHRDDQSHALLRQSPFRGFKLHSIRTCTITTACYSHWSHIVHVAPCLLRKRFLLHLQWNWGYNAYSAFKNASLRPKNDRRDVSQAITPASAPLDTGFCSGHRFRHIARELPGAAQTRGRDAQTPALLPPGWRMLRTHVRRE